MIRSDIIPILEDNYTYVLSTENGACAVVDPAEATSVIEFLDHKNLRPQLLLITHHHADHTGGIKELKKRYGCDVYGPASEQEKIGGVTLGLKDQQTFSFGGEQVRVIETPGHTRGHICYVFTESHLLFSGDTLFTMGCGRVFEGSMEQMYRSLEKLRELPADTKIYSGHEYTLSNAAFAHHIFPENLEISARYEEMKELRARNIPTVPSTLSEERRTNPFFLAKDVGEFSNLRCAKDRF